MMHLAPSRSGTAVQGCPDPGAGVQNSRMNGPRPYSPHPSPEATGKPLSPGASPPSLATSPNLPNVSWAEGEPQDPTPQAPAQSQPPYLSVGGGVPSLMPRWLSSCCPFCLHSPQLPPEHPLAGVPTRCPLLHGLQPRAPPRPAVATSAHGASAIWSPALTSPRRVARAPSSPGHVLEGRGTDGVCSGSLGQGWRKKPPKERGEMGSRGL